MLNEGHVCDPDSTDSTGELGVAVEADGAVAPALGAVAGLAVGVVRAERGSRL